MDFSWPILLESLEHGLLHTIEHTWTMLPLMFLAYLIIEWFERRPTQNDSLFWNLQKWGPLFGACIGLLPQCSFSVLAALLFCQKNITLGTLLAVFITCSDEAIPVMLAEPSMIKSLIWILLLKFIIAILSGFCIDRWIFPHQKIRYFSEIDQDESQEEHLQDDEDHAKSCSCCYPQYSIWLSALLRTLKIFAFVFIITLFLELALDFISQETLRSILLTGSIWQPLAAGIFGLLPNCAASVILCQLFFTGTLTFPSLLAGLISNAGFGLVVLFQYDDSKYKKKFFQIVGLLLLISLLSGYAVLLVQSLIPA